MSEAGRPILTRPSSITIIALVLLLMISFSWNGCARARMDAQLVAETEQLAMQQEEFLSFKQLQKQLVVRALQKTNGQKMAAAKLLEIDHRKLDNLVERFDLQASWK